MIDTKEIREWTATAEINKPLSVQFLVRRLCDRIDELERKLKIADGAIKDSNKVLTIYDNNLCNSTLNRNIDALKQIRGE